MSLSAALHATLAVLRRRPADLLPLYMLGAAVTAIARVGTFAGLVVAYLYLETSGRLEAVRRSIAGRDLNPPDPEARPEAFAEWVDGIVPLVDPLFPPFVVALLVLSIVVSLLAALVLAATVAAGQVAACDARLRGRRGLTAGIDGAVRHWRAFLAAFLLEGLVWIVASGVALAVVAGGAAVASPVGLLVAPLAFLLWLAVVVVARGLFAFVPVAIVVDGVGVVDAIRSSAGFVRDRPVDAVGYYGIAAGVLVAFATAIGVLSVVEAGAVAAPIAFLVVSPSLDLVKVGLYEAHRGSLSLPDAPVVPVREQVEAGVRRGLGAVVAFVRETPGLHALAIAVGVVGVAMGWVAAGPLVGSLSTSIEARLADLVPPAAALRFFANNWTVAVSIAFAGLALAVPTALGIWFNGFVLGVYARLEVAPLSLAAFVVPHSFVEIPSLVVAGALGGYLGVAAWRTWRGRAGKAALAGAMERAFWVLVGLGVLLAVAGLIEGFVSPYLYRLLV